MAFLSTVIQGFAVFLIALTGQWIWLPVALCYWSILLSPLCLYKSVRRVKRLRQNEEVIQRPTWIALAIQVILNAILFWPYGIGDFREIRPEEYVVLSFAFLVGIGSVSVWLYLLTPQLGGKLAMREPHQGKGDA